MEKLFYLPDNSLIKQSYNPLLMKGKLNLAGFGFSAWKDGTNKHQVPNLYRTCELPFYDKNLRNIAINLEANCVLAHVRGVYYSEKEIISIQNVHPFLYEGTSLAFAHNGGLFDHTIIKDDILRYIKPIFRNQIHGTTDSELLYALFISQLKYPDSDQTIEVLFAGLLKTIDILVALRKKHKITISSPLNLFISNGKVVVASRYILDYGHFNHYKKEEEAFLDTQYNSLWYTFGEEYSLYDNQFQMTPGKANRSTIIASEPLTKDQTTWIEVPEYSFIGASMEDKIIKIQSLDIIL
jgi:glutamine amidotransferase